MNASGETPGNEPNELDRALEKVVSKASRRQRRLSIFGIASSVIAIGAIGTAGITLAQSHSSAPEAASTGPASRSATESPQSGPPSGSAGSIAQNSGPSASNNSGVAAWFTRTTPSGAEIVAYPWITASSAGCPVRGSTSGSSGSATASSGTVQPLTGAASVAPTTTGVPTAPTATTPLEIASTTQVPYPGCVENTTPAKYGLEITVSSGAFSGSFLATGTNPHDQSASIPTYTGSWHEQVYELPDGSRLVAVSISLPSGNPLAALDSAQRKTLDGPVGPTTGYAGPYSNQGGWAVLATIVKSGESTSLLAPGYTVELELAASQSASITLPPMSNPAAHGADAASVSGIWTAG